MIIVLDSNVWISAFRFGGIALTIVNLSLTSHQVAICDEIKLEVRDVLGRKFNLSDAQIDALTEPYFSLATTVTIVGTLQNVCRDPKDNMILECSAVANADLIVTGDYDLRSLKTFGTAQIISLRDFLNQQL